MASAWGNSWGKAWGSSWGTLYRSGPNKHKRVDVLRRVFVSLSIIDDDDTLNSAVHANHVATIAMAVKDADDTLKAGAVVFWKEAKLVIDRARLVRAPAVKLVRSKYEAVT